MVLQTALVKTLNRNWGLYWPVYTAVLYSVGWPVFLVPYCYFLYKKAVKLPSKNTVLKYIGLGLLDATDIVLVSFGLNWVNGVTYAAVKSTGVIFNVIF